MIIFVCFWAISIGTQGLRLALCLRESHLVEHRRAYGVMGLNLG